MTSFSETGSCKVSTFTPTSSTNCETDCIRSADLKVEKSASVDCNRRFSSRVRGRNQTSVDPPKPSAGSPGSHLQRRDAQQADFCQEVKRKRDPLAKQTRKRSNLCATAVVVANSLSPLPSPSRPNLRSKVEKKKSIDTRSTRSSSELSEKAPSPVLKETQKSFLKKNQENLHSPKDNHPKEPRNRTTRGVHKSSPLAKRTPKRCCPCKHYNGTYCHSKMCVCKNSNKGCTNCLNNELCRNPFPKNTPSVVSPPSIPIFNQSPEPLNHAKPSNQNTPSIQRQPKLNLPCASKKSVWTTINKIFQDTLPGLFPPQLINALSTTELAESFDDFVYTALWEHFGEVKSVQIHSEKSQQNKKMIELRNQKKELKRARKLLHKNGGFGTAAARQFLKSGLPQYVNTVGSQDF